MLSVDTIKRYLKQIMKSYALIFEKDADLDFNASVYKDNNIICFNEDKIFKEIYSHYLYNKSYRKKRCKDFAFILNMYFFYTKIHVIIRKKYLIIKLNLRYYSRIKI